MVLNVVPEGHSTQERIFNISDEIFKARHLLLHNCISICVDGVTAILCHRVNTASHHRRLASSGMFLKEVQISCDTNIITAPTLHFQFPFIDTQEDIYSSFKLIREQTLDHNFSFWWQKLQVFRLQMIMSCLSSSPSWTFSLFDFITARRHYKHYKYR